MTTWVALVAFAVRTEDPPEAMEVGFALSVTVAALAVTVTVAVAVALPPGPLAVAV
jgi:hypothetical protein